MFNNFFPEDLALFEIMWKNMIKPERPQIKTQYNTVRAYCVLEN
jgi:hypothetical protein